MLLHLARDRKAVAKIARPAHTHPLFSNFNSAKLNGWNRDNETSILQAETTSPIRSNIARFKSQPWRTNAANLSICKPSPTHIVTKPSPLTPNSYVPRKCSATNRIIKAKDHASVQISVGKVDENGRYTGDNQVYALCGFVRAMGESDDCVNRLAQRDGFLKGVWSASR